MKTQNFIYAAFAGIILASCSSNDFAGDHNLLENSGGGGAIAFSSSTPAITRADKTGSAAASDLNNQFIVWGEKNETGDNVGTAAGETGRLGDLVFKNYLVDWVDNSAYTTTSNTKGWEYVGLKLNDGTASPVTTTYSTHILPNSGTDAQTIKYWDYGASTYTFTAVSALPADITAGNVAITKTQTGASVYDKGYTVALTTAATLDKLYFSERNNIATSANTDRTQPNEYGGNVTFRFHNTATKVRVAMYETVPGYSVTIKEFKVADTADPAFSTMTTSKTANFAANLQNCAQGTAGTLTVKYVADAGATQNHPTVSFDGIKANILALGDQLKAGVTIGESTTYATYDKSAKAYTSVFPNETNTQNLKLKLSYTLTAPGTNETIEITDKTAEIPAQYLKWKPGYAYTYIFKITDDALYPITFDAVTIEAEDGTVEYITTVTEPSITTFGVKGGKYVTGGNDYPASTAVYATVMDASALATLDANNFKIYDVTTSDATNFPVTEASVAEALIEGPTWTAAQAALKKITCAAGPTLTFQNTVPAEDGTTITLDASNNKAATFTTATGRKYALVYQKTAATYTVSGAQTFATEDLFNAAGTLYTTSACTDVATWVNSTTEYYKRTAVSDKGNYIVKIVTVQ